MKHNEIRKYAGLEQQPEAPVIEETVEVEEDLLESQNYPMDDMHALHDMHNALNQLIMRNMSMMKNGHDMAKKHATALDVKLVAMRDDCFKFSKKFEAEMKKDEKK